MSYALVHLTDIHINSKSDPILGKSEEIVRAVNSVLHNGVPVILVISGDIAFSGKKEQYDAAFAFLSKIKAGIEGERHTSCQIIAVPGNHDCDFDADSPMRTRLLSSVNGTTTVIDEESYKSITAVEGDFFAFADQLASPFKRDKLCTDISVRVGDKKLLFLLFNTAWMSSKNEKPGTLILPEELFPACKAKDYDFVISVLHHPFGWFHPDNSAQLVKYLKNTTDIIIFGHEHREELFQISGNMWSICLLRGKALQQKGKADSGFAVYAFEDGSESISAHYFDWAGNKYGRKDETITFTRNSLIASQILAPAKEYMKSIRDPGMIINHFRVESPTLPDLYCWPDLEQVTFEEKGIPTRVKENTLDALLSANISIVIGDALSGKTSMAKMLFYELSSRETCGLFCEGSLLTTHNASNLRAKIEDCFAKEYVEALLEDFRQLPKEKRVLIIDNFLDMPYHDERRSKVLSILSEDFSHIVFFSDNEIDSQLVCSNLDGIEALSINIFHIMPFGNVKRQEFVKKWYCLGDEYANGERSTAERIDLACEKINLIIGNRGIIPAYPIYMINLLQNIESASHASFTGSQYGFLYESLINKSLSTISSRYRNPGDVNVDISVMSQLAFELLHARITPPAFSWEQLLAVGNEVSKAKKIMFNCDSLISKMLDSRLIIETEHGSYRFTYPYIFYYFAGRYIAYHLNLPTVVEMRDHMCQHLYNEVYGSILIFVCHFSNNQSLIEEIVLNAMLLLEAYEPFDFSQHSEFFNRARERIEQFLIPDRIGTDKDVETNKRLQLEQQDERGILDGCVQEPEEISEEVTDQERKLASIASAMHTMDVLGQILKNYPGDIDGDLKIEIIDQIHQVGMKIMQLLFSTIVTYEDGLIRFLAEKAKGKNKSLLQPEVEQRTMEMLICLFAGAARGMISKIAFSLNNESLLPAIDEAFSKNPCSSQQLADCDLRVNMLKRFSVDGVISWYEKLRQNKEWLIATILRSIVAYYLRYNHCSIETRKKLCSAFSFKYDDILIAREWQKQLN